MILNSLSVWPGDESALIHAVYHHWVCSTFLADTIRSEYEILWNDISFVEQPWLFMNCRVCRLYITLYRSTLTLQNGKPVSVPPYLSRRTFGEHLMYNIEFKNWHILRYRHILNWNNLGKFVGNSLLVHYVLWFSYEYNDGESKLNTLSLLSVESSNKHSIKPDLYENLRRRLTIRGNCNHKLLRSIMTNKISISVVNVVGRGLLNNYV